MNSPEFERRERWKSGTLRKTPPKLRKQIEILETDMKRHFFLVISKFWTATVNVNKWMKSTIKISNFIYFLKIEINIYLCVKEDKSTLLKQLLGYG